MTTRNGMVLCPQPVPGARIRLFLLHHAGGSHLAFRQWHRFFPADWEICLIEAPGRGHLLDQEPYRDARELAAALAGELIGWMQLPYAVFGHSMGGLIGYELALAMCADRLPPPIWLGISGRAPEMLRGPQRHRMPTGQLQDTMLELGGTPVEVVRDRDLWTMIEPMLRADCEAAETWAPKPDTPRVPVPISSFGGSCDVLAGESELESWSRLTDRFFGSHVYQGGHFYFTADPARLINDMTVDIRLAWRAQEVSR